jgi:hypothetical protein
MKTILSLLKLAGGYRPLLYLRVENPPYLPLVLSATSVPGPLGLRALALTHYAPHSGSLARDPEMLFELSNPFCLGLRLVPYFWCNDLLGTEQFSRYRTETHYVFDPDLYERHERIARAWDAALARQGILAAYQRHPSRH